MPTKTINQLTLEATPVAGDELYMQRAGGLGSRKVPVSARTWAGGVLVKLDAVYVTAQDVASFIQWESSEYDTDSFWSSTVNPSRITVPSGITRAKVFAGVLWESDPTTFPISRMSLYRDGAQTAYGVGDMVYAPRVSAWNNIELAMSITTPVVDVVEGTYFEIEVLQSQGTTLDIKHDSGARTYFSLQVISRTT